MPPRRILAALAASAVRLVTNASADETSTLDRIEVTGIDSGHKFRRLVVSAANPNVTRPLHPTQVFGGVRWGALRLPQPTALILTRAHHQVETQNDSRRPDVSRVALQVKLTLSDAPNDGVEQNRSGPNKFNRCCGAGKPNGSRSLKK